MSHTAWESGSGGAHALGYFKVTDKAAGRGFALWMGLMCHGESETRHQQAMDCGVTQSRMHTHAQPRCGEVVSRSPVGMLVIITAGTSGVLGSARPRIEPGAKGSYVYRSS